MTEPAEQHPPRLRERRWDTSQKFVLTRGEFDREAESELYAKGVRFEMGTGSYRWACYIETSHALIAQADAHVRLMEMLRPYDVATFVFDTRVVALQ